MAEKIGSMDCPLCKAKARVSLSKSGLPVMTCAGCHTQIFSRGGHSDLILRAALHKSDPDPAPAPAADPAPQPHPAPAAPPPPARAKPARQRDAWHIW